MQVAGTYAQTVPVNITQFTVTSPTITFGQNQSYGAVVTSNPLFPGPFLWQNGTQTIATLSSLSNATSEGVFLGGAVSPRHIFLPHAVPQQGRLLVSKLSVYDLGHSTTHLAGHHRSSASNVRWQQTIHGHNLAQCTYYLGVADCDHGPDCEWEERHARTRIAMDLPRDIICVGVDCAHAALQVVTASD